MTIEVKSKACLSPAMACVEDILEKTNAPMSINEIVERFSPHWPFSVKRVIAGPGIPEGAVVEIFALSPPLSNATAYSVCDRCRVCSAYHGYLGKVENKNVPGYICNCGIGLMLPDVKAWVLV